MSTIYSLWKSTNRLSLSDCFHFLTVVIWLRSHSSEPFAYAMAARFRLALKQKQIQGDGPSNVSACEDMTYCHAPEIFRTQLAPSYYVYRDEFARFQTVKTSRTSLFLSVCFQLTKVIVSTLFPTRPRVSRSQLTRPLPRQQPQALSLLP